MGVRRVLWAGRDGTGRCWRWLAGRPPNARRAAQSMLEPGGVAQMEAVFMLDEVL